MSNEIKNNTKSIKSTKNKHAVLSLSGGMDSSSLMLRLLADGYEVTAISFDYGQKHKVELEKALSLTDYLKQQGFKVKHHIITIDGLSQLLHSALISGGEDVPTGHYHESNMRLTVVPNRNKIFSSIIQAAALSIAEAQNTDVIIAMGVHGGDHATYPDCRQLFRDKDYDAFIAGNWDAEKVTYYLPYINSSKTDVLRDGMRACESLGLKYEEVYEMTFTSYIPVEHDNTIYSDYQSASSIGRIEAFLNLGLQDPAAYADELGPVTWQTVKAHAQKTLTEFKKQEV
ncbi:7-cyano-7-deazaguanine synthase [Cysteiniphilum sp. JM-1]|uniref:7-cyano-7-deazaguanine synthase n=1 Tax=Cysteiniphilum sp. JM-1 TaxID=2610891 RepID=UPI001248754A|nr:7-cyano-7-deazaguanine synthase [Cysteiniphilum sp. JM-1]